MIIDRPVAILTLSNWLSDPSACPIAVGIKTAPCIDECVVCIWPKKNKKYLASLLFSHGLQSCLYSEMGSIFEIGTKGSYSVYTFYVFNFKLLAYFTPGSVRLTS